MKARRQLMIWLAAAVVALAFLTAVLYRESQRTRDRFGTFLEGDPQVGARLFDAKACRSCHAVHGIGGRVGPDLGVAPGANDGLAQMVTAMWNHAPLMWHRMEGRRLRPPSLNEEEITHLFAFLYSVRYADEPGELPAGALLFRSKGCVECHAGEGESDRGGPPLSGRATDNSITWAQTMWNHAPAMEERMQDLQLAWPRFQGREMNDLLAYLRQGRPETENAFTLLPADADRGRRLFRSKRCADCHSIGWGKTGSAPGLGPRTDIAPTIVQFAGQMWSHSPEMWQAMQARGIARPTFEGQEMADLVAFLKRLRYFDHRGSPEAGRLLFEARGCSRCHGEEAEGTARAPALRQKGQAFTSIRLATALWQHGPGMYAWTRGMGMSWPQLEGDDLNDLISFLNLPPEKRGRR